MFWILYRARLRREAHTLHIFLHTHTHTHILCVPYWRRSEEKATINKYQMPNTGLNYYVARINSSERWLILSTFWVQFISLFPFSPLLRFICSAVFIIPPFSNWYLRVFILLLFYFFRSFTITLNTPNNRCICWLFIQCVGFNKQTDRNQFK